MSKGWTLGLLLAVVLVGSQADAARERYPFRYVGGTRGPAETCKGVLETSSTDITFRCADVAIAIPYSSITLMQYRADISSQVRRMNLHWKLAPPIIGGGPQNRYFTIVYDSPSGPEGLVLQVSPEIMRPYLAEIDLSTGRRVEVQSHETYSFR